MVQAPERRRSRARARTRSGQPVEAREVVRVLARVGMALLGEEEGCLVSGVLLLRTMGGRGRGTEHWEGGDLELTWGRSAGGGGGRAGLGAGGWRRGRARGRWARGSFACQALWRRRTREPVPFGRIVWFGVVVGRFGEGFGREGALMIMCNE